MNPSQMTLVILVLSITVLYCLVQLWLHDLRIKALLNELNDLKREMNAVPESLAQAHEYITSQRQDIVRLYSGLQSHDRKIFLLEKSHVKRRSHSSRSR